MSVTEKHIIKSERVERDGEVFWRLFLYYPSHGHVRVAFVPQMEYVPVPSETIVEEVDMQPEVQPLEDTEDAL